MSLIISIFQSILLLAFKTIKFIFHLLIFILGILGAGGILYGVFEYSEFLYDVSLFEYIYLFVIGCLLQRYWRNARINELKTLKTLFVGFYLYGIYSAINVALLILCMWLTKSSIYELYWLGNSNFKVLFMLLDIAVFYLISIYPLHVKKQVILEAEIVQPEAKETASA